MPKEAYKSYSDSLEDDLKDLSTSQELQRTRSHDIHILRLNNFKFVVNKLFLLVVSIITLGAIVFGLHYAWNSHYEKVRDNNNYWISQCEGAGGHVLYNNVKKYQDNVCAFPNGFSVPRSYTKNG